MVPFICDAFLFQPLKQIPWRWNAERALHYGWHCVCKVSFCMFTLWLAVRSKRNHYYSHVLIHCLNVSAKIKSEHHSNHLIKTEEFIGNDLHKVQIKSVPPHNQPQCKTIELPWKWSWSYNTQTRAKHFCARMKFVRIYIPNCIVQLHRRSKTKRANDGNLHFNVNQTFVTSGRGMACRITVQHAKPSNGREKKKIWIIEARIELLAGEQKQTENQWIFFVFQCSTRRWWPFWKAANSKNGIRMAWHEPTYVYHSRLRLAYNRKSFILHTRQIFWSERNESHAYDMIVWHRCAYLNKYYAWEKSHLIFVDNRIHFSVRIGSDRVMCDGEKRIKMLCSSQNALWI